VCKDRYWSIVPFDIFQGGNVKVTKKIWNSYLKDNDLVTFFITFSRILFCS